MSPKHGSLLRSQLIKWPSDGAQSTCEEHEARPAIPPNAALSTPAAMLHQGFHIQDGVLCVDVLKEIVNEIWYPLLIWLVEPRGS